ncbi:MAG: AbrB/MazE/SpoVT family DNA-binding domain-containing protein [Clostridia bacterium]|nr:AbrB/MazE/SpoVT family DNA-binding domain-containing protein [Clostridia bacterium]
MNPTGMVRRIYPNGSIVIPKEIRKTLCIEDGDPFEFFIGENNEIILKQYIPEDSSFDMI